MKKVQIKLSDIGHIRNFGSLLSKYSVELDLQQGRYVVDAKSPMGIYALDLLNPINFIIHSDDDSLADAILETVKEWII